jgi:hypothetical protein
MHSLANAVKFGEQLFRPGLVRKHGP